MRVTQAGIVVGSLIAKLQVIRGEFPTFRLSEPSSLNVSASWPFEKWLSCATMYARPNPPMLPRSASAKFNFTGM